MQDNKVTCPFSYFILATWTVSLHNNKSLLLDLHSFNNALPPRLITLLFIDI